MSDLLTFLNQIRKANQSRRISFVSGNFKVIHPGHIRLLRQAREMADLLVVGVLPRNEFNCEIGELDRLSNVQELGVVDYAVLLDESIESALRVLKPDFVIKGKEHETCANAEAQVLAETGGKLIFSSGLPLPSSMDRVRVPSLLQSCNIVMPGEYMARRGITVQSLAGLVHDFRNMRVCVIGDVIVDEYINCDALGMSQEEPTIVVTPTETRRYLGGAGIVAAHARGLGASVHFTTVCGADAAYEFVRSKCRDYDLDFNILTDSSRPTTLKQRFRCKDKTLLKVSHLRQNAIDKQIIAKIVLSLESQIADADLLIFSDFNYGCLPQPLVDSLYKITQKTNTLIAVDSQSSSQIGDVSRFLDASLLTPTEREARLATHDYESGLVVLIGKLLKKARAANAILTLGEAGVLVQNKHTETDQLPALNPACVDVAGAGDSLLVAASLALAAKGDIWQAALLGSIAAGLQVGREGNIPLTLAEMNAILQQWNR